MSVDVCCVNITVPAEQDFVLEIGKVDSSDHSASVHQVVQKYPHHKCVSYIFFYTSRFGTETLLTVGCVRDLSYTVPGKFDGIVVSGTTGKFADEGDSGSVVVSLQNEIIGMVRGGAGPLSVVIPWSQVIGVCKSSAVTSLRIHDEL